MIDEDHFPPITSVNIVATDLRAVLDVKKDERFSPSAMIRKVWIPKQYIVHNDEWTVKGKVSITRENEKNGRYLYYSKQEIKKEKPSKEKKCFSKRETFLSRGKGHEYFEENTSKVCCYSSCST